MEEKFLNYIIEYLIAEYSCHSIILYGSFANGSYTDESDIDLICFSDNHKKENDTTVLNDRQLDAWIYNTEAMDDATQFLHIRGGEILLDKKNKCIDFLNDIDKEFAMGPKQLTVKEKDFLRDWLQKMLRRAKKGDIEGNFRYHWMLTDALEIYFDIKGIWYLGPKKSLQWLYENDKGAYEIFDNALRINADIGAIEGLVRYIAKS